MEWEVMRAKEDAAARRMAEGEVWYVVVEVR